MVQRGPALGVRRVDEVPVALEDRVGLVEVPVLRELEELAWAVSVDQSRLAGEGVRSSACLPASVKCVFFGPKMNVSAQMCFFNQDLFRKNSNVKVVRKENIESID